MADPRFKNINFWKQEFDAYFNNNPLFNTPGNKDMLLNEFLNLTDFSKTFLENLYNICMTTHDASNVIAFYCLQKRLNIPNRTITIIFRHISGVGDKSRNFINIIGSNVLKIEKASKALGAASGFVVCIFTAVQMLVHIGKNEYGLAMGELIKTILSIACAPAAVIDMLDQLIGSFAPWIFNNPFTRALRLFNGLQGAKHLADTVLTFGMVFGYAYQNRNAEVEKALGDLATRWEQSPFGMASYLSRGFVDILNGILPNYKSRLGYIDGWIQSMREAMKNLSDYNHQNYVAY